MLPLHQLQQAQMLQQHQQTLAGPSRIPDRMASDEIDQHPAPAQKRQRKRTDTSDKGGRSRSASDKKKKASRACINCQKSHLTCDDARPCQRCVKRGITESCVEGVRKKAKYLLDDEELAQLRTTKSKGKSADDGDDDHDPNGLGLEPYAQQLSALGGPADPLNNVVLDTKHPFDSQAVNLEYSIMSAILGNDSSASGTPPSYVGPSEYASLNIPYTTGGDYGTLQPATSPFTPASFTGQTVGESVFSESPAQAVDMQMPQQQSVYEPPQQQQQSGTNGRTTTEQEPRQNIVYHTVTKAYDYRESFHFLMRHLKDRYVKNDILRIIRAIAIFRPSVIALCMPLSEEDEVFVEKCFQRSVLELEKLISFNGTPTVAWRRTGEICVVGVEFSILTGWSRDELLGGRKYIYELFENQSAVEYWEQFATHAFENTTQSVHTHCVLLTKTGAPVLTAFCFSIRRDIFDLPNIVIGQWLPLLS